MYIKIVDSPIHPEEIIREARTDNSGCVVTYVGLIRDTSHGKPVATVEYQDTDKQAESRLRKLGEEIMQKFPINNLALCHRTGVLNVGDINIVFAFAAGHRRRDLRRVPLQLTGLRRPCPPKKLRPTGTVPYITSGRRWGVTPISVFPLEGEEK